MKIDQFFKMFEDAIQDAWIETGMRTGLALTNEFKDDLTAAVRQQRYYWPPLNKKYLERKRKAGLDLRMLIATHNYLKEGIKTELKEANLNSLKITYEVAPTRRRIRPSPLNKVPRITYEKLAKIHEYGSGRIPARPHWKPTREAYQAKAPRLAKRLQEDFIRRLNQKTSGFLGT